MISIPRQDELKAQLDNLENTELAQQLIAVLQGASDITLRQIGSILDELRAGQQPNHLLQQVLGTEQSEPVAA